MLRLSAELDYGDGMDAECVALCDAMNSLPGISTEESCCGHGKLPFRAWFRVTDMEGLFFLTRCVDNRYWEHGESWKIELSVGDTVKDGVLPVNFLLEGKLSGELPGQARSLVDNMNHHLNHKNFVRAFDLDLGKFVTDTICK